MSVELQQSSIAPTISALLSRLRARIRSYVWAEGLARVGVVLGLAFWATLGFDWLFEPPWQFRAVMLAGIGTGLAYVIYQHIVRRAFHRLDDSSLALVLERRYPQFHDSLLTAVEMDQYPTHASAFNREMVEYTRRQAVARSSSVQLREVFRVAPLVRTLSFAAALAVSVLAFGVVAQGAFHTWYQRVVMLNKDLLWPRSNHVRVQGFPADHRRKVAKGSDFEVLAAADLNAPFKLPNWVEVRYRTDEGVRNRDNMSTVGAPSPSDPQQKYSFVFKGIMSSIDFDVLGGDDRDRGYRLEVVDNPAISKMELACEYPAYTGRPAGTVPASALVQLPQGTNVTINCQTNKDIDEVQVTVVGGEKAGKLAEIKPSQNDSRQFSLVLPALMEDTTLLFELHDTDGIQSRDPVRLTLIAAPDEAPVVALRLRGVSTAITPNARLPVVGDLHDDYGLTRMWFEYQLTLGTGTTASGTTAPQSAKPPKERNVIPADKEPSAEQQFLTSPLGRDGRPKIRLTIESADDESLDLKRLRDVDDLLRRRGIKTPADLSKITDPEEQKLIANLKTQEQIGRALTLHADVGDRLSVALKAADNCALPAGINVGQGEKYQLEIVPPDQLLSMLEGRELMLRRRFEVIYQEMLDTRDGLARVDFNPPDAKTGADDKAHEPGDEPGDKSTGGDKQLGDMQETPEQRAARLAKRAAEMRDMRVNRTLDNTDRSTSETLTVAESFDDIREEMVNNRIETPAVETRLKDQIADPLRKISIDMFPVLKDRLKQLRQSLDDPKTGKELLQKSLAQADAILVEMKLVLDKMLELETFNEVVEQLRQIIANQGQLSDETLKRQKEELKRKLRDLEK